jgi:hypothetical protein
MPSTVSRLFFNEDKYLSSTEKGCCCYILWKEQFPLSTLKKKFPYKTQLHLHILLVWPNHWQLYQLFHWMRYVTAPVIIGFIYIESHDNSVLHQVKFLSYKIYFLRYCTFPSHIPRAIYVSYLHFYWLLDLGILTLLIFLSHHITFWFYYLTFYRLCFFTRWPVGHKLGFNQMEAPVPEIMDTISYISEDVY